MLQISYIRENKESVINGLKKRNFKELELVEEAIALDEQRRLVQTKLDNALAESNKLSKEIGTLMKEGKRQEAEVAKVQTADLKEQIKQYSTTLDQTILSLNDILYRIPNIPNAIVPEGRRTILLCSKQAKCLISLKERSPTGNWLRNTTSLTLS